MLVPVLGPKGPWPPAPPSLILLRGRAGLSDTGLLSVACLSLKVEEAWSLQLAFGPKFAGLSDGGRPRLTGTIKLFSLASLQRLRSGKGRCVLKAVFVFYFYLFIYIN